MRVLLALDSFKESMTSLEAARAFARGFKRALPKTRFITASISDGGEGFTESLLYTGNGRRITKRVKDARGRAVSAGFGLFDRGKKAVVEMAKASGLQMLPRPLRNPMKTSTFGTGQLVDAALKRGVKTLIVGIGGSATSDGGIGMAQALGVRFYDKSGRVLKTPAAGGDLTRIARIDLNGLPKRTKAVRVVVACDVNNPMTGKNGAAHVYGPQKGATPAMVRTLDAGLKNLCRVVKKDLGKSIEFIPGAGAAGGLGGGLIAFLGARLAPGIQIMLDTIGFGRLVRGADLVVTGEGQIDGQTVRNKAPIGVALAAKKASVPVIGVCGNLGPGARKVYGRGIRALFSIVPGPASLDAAVRQGPQNLAALAENIARFIKTGIRP
jgi:glycerate kinase